MLSSEELDGLNLFFVEVVDPYHTESIDSDEVVKYRLVRKGEGPLVSERLSLTMDGKLLWDEEESRWTYQNRFFPLGRSRESIFPGIGLHGCKRKSGGCRCR